MKRFFFFSITVLFLVSCGNRDHKNLEGVILPSTKVHASMMGQKITVFVTVMTNEGNFEVSIEQEDPGAIFLFLREEFGLDTLIVNFFLQGDKTKVLSIIPD